MERVRVYPFWLKLLVSAFIVFHWACVIPWLLQPTSPLRAFALSLKLPLPTGQGEEGSFVIEPRLVVRAYLYNTAQWQNWGMFAPNPLQINRYVAATVHFRDGSQREFHFPRLSQLGVVDAWIEKRYRKYQHRIVDGESAPFRDDLARYIARRLHDPANPPTRVVIYHYEYPIPRHDRPELSGSARPARIDYTRLLRNDARYTRSVLRDYRVKPEDLL